MKSKLLLLSSALLLSHTVSIAQCPTLTFANIGLQTSDVIKTYSADTTGIVQGTSGANQTWNFGSLVISSTSNTKTCVAPSGTPSSSSFPAATVSINYSNIYDYYTINSTEYTYLGTASSNPTMAYSDPQKILTYPFSYTNTFTDNIAATYLLGVNTVRTGTSTTTADAWGTVILPSGSYSNTLRIKIIQNYVDSNIYFKATTHQESYLWFDGTHKNPILNINKTRIVNPLSGTTVTKSVSVSSDVYGNGIEKYNDNLIPANIFPNPATDKVTIAFDLKEKSNTEISIFDMQGREAIHYLLGYLEAGANQKEIDISDIPQDIYFIRISAKDGFSYKKIMIN
jgi:hypothetical protein